MSKLDQFFREKLGDREFSDNMGAWKEMEGMLEEQDSGKPGFGWLWVGVLVVVLGSGWLVSSQFSSKQIINEQLISVEGNDQGVGEVGDLVIGVNDRSAREQALRSTDESEVMGGDELNENGLMKDDDETGFENTANKPIGEVVSVNASATIDAATDKGTASSKVNNAAIISDLHIEHKNISSGSENENRNEKQIESENIKSANKILTVPKSRNISTLMDKEKNSSDNTEEDKRAEINDMKAGNKLEVELLEAELITSLANRNQNFSPVIDVKMDKVIMNTDEQDKLPGNPYSFYRHKTWKAGIFAEQSLFIPFNNNQNVSVSSIGLMTQFEWNKNWDFQTGLHYQLINTRELPQDTIVQRAYSFGLREKTSTTAISALHYVGWQGLMVRKFNLLEIGFGLEVNANLGVNGTLQTEQSKFPFEDTSVEAVEDQKGALKSDPVNRFVFQPQLKLSYTVARNTTINLGLKYQLNDFVENNSETSTPPAWNSNALQMKIGLSYYFFTRKQQWNEQ